MADYSTSEHHTAQWRGSNRELADEERKNAENTLRLIFDKKVSELTTRDRYEMEMYLAAYEVGHGATHYYQRICKAVLGRPENCFVDRYSAEVYARNEVGTHPNMVSRIEQKEGLFYAWFNLHD